MESRQEISNTVQSGGEERLTFDEYLEQLPSSKQATHRWLGWLIIVVIVITVGVFAYAIYASFAWQTVGGEKVILAWLYFFLVGALAAFTLGLDTLFMGATIPLPFASSGQDFETGRKALTEGWSLVGYGVVVTALVALGVSAVRTGTFSVEDWVTVIVGGFVILGMGSGVLAIIRRFRRPGNT